MSDRAPRHGADASEQELRDQAEQLAFQNATLAEIGRVISSSLDIDEVYERFTRQVRGLVPFDRIVIVDIDVDRDVFTARYVQGMSVPEMDTGEPRPLQRSLVAEVARSPSGLVMSFDSAEEAQTEFHNLLYWYSAGIRAAVGVPLVSRDNAIGVMFLVSTTPKAYDDTAREMVNRVGNQIAGAVANAQLYVERQRAENELRTARDELEARVRERTAELRASEEKALGLAQENAVMAEIGRIMSSSLEIAEVYERFAEQVRKLIPFDRLNVNLVGTAEGVYRVGYNRGPLVPGREVGQELPLEGSLTGSVASRPRRHVTWAEDDDNLEAFEGAVPFVEAGFKSSMGVALVSRGTVHGVLIFDSWTAHQYSEAHLSVAERVADEIAGAVVNAQLYAKRMRTDEELRVQAAALDAAANAMVITDSHGIITWINPAFTRLTGYSADEAVGRNMRLLKSGIQEKNFYEEMWDTISAGRVWSGEIINQRKDRSVYTEEQTITPVQDEQGAITHFITVKQDISARKHAEETLRQARDRLEERIRERTAELSDANLALRERNAERNRVERLARLAQEEFRHLVDSVEAVAWEADLQTCRFIFISVQAEQLLGYPTGRWLDDPTFWQEHIHDDDRERVVGLSMGLTVGDDPQEIEYRLLAADGRVVWVRDIVRVDLQYGDSPKLRGLMVDITERKRTEAAVMDERSRLAREIHDWLAQRLTGIVVQLESVGRMVATNPSAVLPEIDLVRRLARESLEDARRSVWDLQPTALESGDLVEAIQQEAEKHRQDGCPIALEITGRPPGTLSWRNELVTLRVVQEALSNIRRHSQASAATMKVTYDDDGVYIEIVDDGVGFDPSTPRGVMSPIGGGFGINGMQERVRFAGGTIEIHSAPMQGTRVEAWVPYDSKIEAANLARYAVEGPPRRPPAPQGGPRVLIVDDHAIVRQGIRHALEESGAVTAVGEAGDGEEAIEKIRSLSPDVTLMDIRMPRLSGVEAMRRIRELNLDARVILLSAFTDDQYIFEGLSAGAKGYLVKDVDRSELIRAVEAVHAGGSLLQSSISTRLIKRLDEDEPPAITPRALDVLRLLAAGSTNKQIAAELSVTTHTVKFHTENLYRKLGVRSRAEAVRVAIERGLLAV